MRGIPGLLWNRIEAFIEKAPIPSVDKIRFRQFTVFVLLGVPTMVAYGLYDLEKGEYVLSSIIFASAFGLSAGLYALGRMERGILVYRINALVYCFLLVYMLVIGGVGGSKILWMYTFPFIALFLIGKREGILWAGGMLLLGAAFMMGAVPGMSVYPYPKDFRIRFLTTYAIVAAIAIWFEHFRETYRTGMEAKYLELEDEKTKSQESEEDLKKAQQFANVGSWTWHIQSNRLEWSEQMFRIFGIDKDGFTGDLEEVIARAIHPDDRAAVERSNMFVVRDKKPMPLEYRVLQPDGTVRTVWAEAGELILDDAGKPAVLRGIVQDITDRKRAEAALRESEKRFRGIFNAANDGIVNFKLSTKKFVEANDAICEMLGYTREELMRLGVEDIHPAPDLPHVIAECNRQNRGEIRVAENLPVKRKDGSVFYADISANPVEFEGEKYQIGIFRDITERKRSEQTQALMAAMLDATPGFVGFADAKDTNILYINQAGRKMVGIQAQEDVTQFKIADVHPKWANKRLHDEIIPMAIRDGMWIGENAFLNRDGREIPVLMVLLSHKTPKGEVERFSTVSIDITDRKLAEEEKEKLQSQLQQAMKMEAVGRLAGGVAHDFNNLLTAIIGNVSLALMKLSPSDPSAGMLIEANKASERAARLIQQLLAFSRKQIIEPKVMDLNDLIAGMKTMLARLIGENIELRTVPGVGLGLVKVDPGQIEQILMNLAVNARDAMPDGGKLIIETANADLDADYCARHPYTTPGQFVMLAVTDTGHGMSEEVKKQIFEPFFTTKPMGSGTGLGLSTIYGAVKQSAGHIEVSSEVGRGTTFRIYLPRVVEEEDPKAESDKGLADLPEGSETVLVVEDEDFVRELCVKLLERLGYTVLQASNGDEVIALAREHVKRIDLLITDVVMPGINGSELATQLVLHHPGMKVLFMSGYTDDVISHHGVLDEDVSFIGKPFSLSALAKKVRDVLDKT